MNKFLVIIMLAAAMLSAMFGAAGAAAGALGYEMGDSVDGEPDGYDDNGLAFKEVDAIPPFDFVAVSYTQSEGICIVSAFQDTDNHSHGYKRRSVVDGLVGKLSMKYGESEKFDFLFPGSIWDEPQDWDMAIRKGERIYGYVFNAENGSELPDDIKSIAVRAETFGLSLTYRFSNIHRCKSEGAKELSDLL